MTTVELLREARRLIAEFGWTQGVSARNLERKPVLPTDPTAVAFCATGALDRAYRNFCGFPLQLNADVFVALVHGMGGNNTDDDSTVHIIHFNDALGRTVDQVLGVYDRAIVWAERRDVP